MPLASLGFLVGVLICQSLSELPMREWSFILIILLPLVLRFPEYRFVTLILIGFLYSVLIAHSKLATQISPDLEGKDLLVTGTISAITGQTAQRTRFLLNVSDLSEFAKVGNDAQNNRSIKNTPHRLQLSWYQYSHDFIVGQRWQLKVRLKQPRGFSNPGGFDYAGWLYQNGIDATGYVRSGNRDSQWNKLLGHELSLLILIQQLRMKLSEKIYQGLKTSEHSSLITALVVGDRQKMSDEQWSTLTRTGTNHLMAISGLHIGLIAAIFFYLANRMWRILPGAALKIAAPRVAATIAIMAALIYAALAGFTLPTQRAFIMISVVMLAVWLQRPLVSSQVLATALLVVLVYDPMSVMSGGFWLSFAAVAVILFTMSNRLYGVPADKQSVKHWWWKWGRVQWVIAIGLLPSLLFLFQQVPLLSPLANFIAVPVVSLFTVPLSLLGGALVLIAPAVGNLVLSLADFSLVLLWPLLEKLAAVESLVFTAASPPTWTLIPALIGIILLLAPRGLPARWTGIIWLLPLVFYPRPDIPDGAYRFTLLDVGHGLATVVETRNHVLIYDVGPRYSENFNAGDFAVLPFLKQAGIERIDRLILSHDDIDHTGGFNAVNSGLEIVQLTLGPGVNAEGTKMDTCSHGDHWQWDGVHFEVLHPPKDYQSRRDNNNSCIVQISTETDKLLLTGDIESEVETQFVKYFAGNDDNLRADVLVVPHHGSLSSSSVSFVHAVRPKYALISAGYRNRYRLPREEVLSRYRDIDAKILNTADTGAISVLMGTGSFTEPSLHRQQVRHYWSHDG